jgi:hypothetical protein
MQHILLYTNLYKHIGRKNDIKDTVKFYWQRIEIFIQSDYNTQHKLKEYHSIRKHRRSNAKQSIQEIFNELKSEKTSPPMQHESVRL